MLPKVPKPVECGKPPARSESIMPEDELTFGQKVVMVLLFAEMSFFPKC